uniref:Protein kinase domain-containing protein n=1 Tax=Mesocestoides corti TaxID=53468 RepID=A0A5K3FQ46_MESCO
MTALVLTLVGRINEVLLFCRSCCMHRNAEMRPTLLQILHHPWLLRYRHVVGRQSPLSAQYAISQVSMGITPHLSTSVTVRSGLNSLAHGVHRHSVDGAVSAQPVQIVKVVSNTAPAFAQAIAADGQTTVGATPHLSTSVTVRSGLNSLAHEVHRQSVDGAVSVPPLQIVKVVGNAAPAVGVDGQFFRCPNDSQNAAPPQENCQLSELARAHSNGSYASSGYYTRSNSLCFEEERSRKGGFGIAYLMGNTQCSQPVLTDINDSQQWREKASTGSSTDSNIWRGAFRPPSCDSSKTIPGFHHSANISCTNLRCLDHVDSHPPQTTHSRSPDEGLPPNIFDGITISAARQSNEGESRRTT